MDGELIPVQKFTSSCVPISGAGYGVVNGVRDAGSQPSDSSEQYVLIVVYQNTVISRHVIGSTVVIIMVFRTLVEF